MKNAKCIIRQKGQSLRKNAERSNNDSNINDDAKKKNESRWVHFSFRPTHGNKDTYLFKGYFLNAKINPDKI